MNETTLCVVGNVATQPVCKETATGTSARFRLAVTSRYLDREKNEWTDGHTNFFTVWARRTLAANVAVIRVAGRSGGRPGAVEGTDRADGTGREPDLRRTSTRWRSATISRAVRRRSAGPRGER